MRRTKSLGKSSILKSQSGARTKGQGKGTSRTESPRPLWNPTAVHILHARLVFLHFFKIFSISHEKSQSSVGTFYFRKVIPQPQLVAKYEVYRFPSDPTTLLRSQPEHLQRREMETGQAMMSRWISTEPTTGLCYSSDGVCLLEYENVSTTEEENCAIWYEKKHDRKRNRVL